MLEEAVLTVFYEVSQKVSNVWIKEGSTFRPHNTMERWGPHIYSQERAFLRFIITWRYHCQVFTTTSLKYQAIHTQYNTAQGGQQHIFQNCKMASAECLKGMTKALL